MTPPSVRQVVVAIGRVDPHLVAAVPATWTGALLVHAEPGGDTDPDGVPEQAAKALRTQPVDGLCLLVGRLATLEGGLGDAVSIPTGGGWPD
jgi:hypothetical protein